MSKIQDCKLTNVGELPFEYYFGGCNTFSFGIMLCFSYTAQQECHSLVQCLPISPNIFSSFNGASFKEEPSTEFPHRDIMALGSYRNSPFATGCYNRYSISYGLKTEILDYEAAEWVQASDYPFSTDNRFGFRRISINNFTQ